MSWLSRAWFKIKISFLPDLAIKPSLSYFLLVFFLIHSSIKQFPGPISWLPKSEISPDSIEVILAIPPRLITQSGGSTLIFSEINLWNIGANGAPSPPFLISLSLKLLITIFFVNWDNKLPSPICLEIFSSGLW